MGKDAHPFLQHQDDIRTQRVLQEVGGALFAAGGGSGTTMMGGGGLGGRKGACSRGRCTLRRWDFQNCRCRREMSAARMALSKTSLMPNWATTLVS